MYTVRMLVLVQWSIDAQQQLTITRCRKIRISLTMLSASRASNDLSHCLAAVRSLIITTIGLPFPKFLEFRRKPSTYRTVCLTL